MRSRAAGLRILSCSHQLAHHGLADGPGAGGISRIEVDPVGAGEPRQCPRRFEDGVGRLSSRPATTWRRPTSFSRWMATSSPAAILDFFITRGNLPRGAILISKRRCRASTPFRARRPTPAEKPTIACRCVLPRWSRLARAIAAGLGAGGGGSMPSRSIRSLLRRW